MKKQEILDELLVLYKRLSENPADWAARENAQAQMQGKNCTVTEHDFYTGTVGYTQGWIEGILKDCGVLK